VPVAGLGLCFVKFLLLPGEVSDRMSSGRREKSGAISSDVKTCGSF